QQLLIQTSPAHPLAKVCTEQGVDILFDQSIGLFLPTFDEQPAKAELASRWIESGAAELSQALKKVAIKGPLTRNDTLCKLICGNTSKWDLNNQVVKIVDFSNRYKKEFGIDSLILSLNNQESVI
ncbi:MAG: hypothetical protein ACD_39C01645G0002, partial [uncultured bacterium]